jgi:6-pyruvoyltetrahydropterin/6-carboxytetrahydropterin synthase
MIEIFKEFTFEAAHHLAANVDTEHPYSQLHGHSFQVTAFFRGELDDHTGWIADFASLDAAIRPVRNLLDHHYLNDIEGLERPTLEVISHWIFERLRREAPSIHRVTVRRGSCGEGCSYERSIVTPAGKKDKNK